MRLSFGGAFLILTGAGLASFACSLDSAAPIVPCSTYGTFAIGDVIRDSVVASSCRESDRTYENLYRFQLTTQAKLRVSLSSPSAAAFLHVTDSAGVLIVNSVYSMAVDTAATVRMILKPGTYYLGVNSWAQSPSGPFRVTTVVDNSPVAGCGSVWVTTGITTAQTITASDCASPLGSKYYSHVYRLVILAGRELKFTEHSTALSPQVYVVSATGGNYSGTSAIDSTGTNAMVDFTTSAEDMLVLYVGSSDSLQTGPYALTIQ